MIPFYEENGIQIWHGDNREVLPLLADASVDSIVTDPPYMLGFMNKDFDSPKDNSAVDVAVWRECLRVLKPGGHLLAFGGSRTYHRLACAIEDAGFEIRDQIQWIYGSGFPKSLDVSKAIDAAAGAARETAGVYTRPDGESRNYGDWQAKQNTVAFGDFETVRSVTTPATDAAKQWNGWGTALKPAHEPIVLARKPLIGTVAENVLQHGTGGLNIDGSRIETSVDDAKGMERCNTPGSGRFGSEARGSIYGGGNGTSPPNTKLNTTQGRWPANVILSHSAECERVGTKRVKGAVSVGRNKNGDEVANKILGARKKDTTDQGYADADGTETVEAWRCVEGCPIAMFPDSDGQQGDIRGTEPSEPTGGLVYGGGFARQQVLTRRDSGSAARFFYCAKSSKQDRDEGLEDLTSRAGSFDKNTSQRIAHRNPDTDTVTYSDFTPSVRRNHHPTVKPTDLMRYLIRLITPPNGTVLDPFAGSGSTGKACAHEGFNAILIEKELEYCELAKRRARLAQGKLRFEATA
jgi:DNA modification methylase